MVSHKVGWDGIRSKEYYDFLSKFETLANEYFDFENWYIHDMIKKFDQNEKVQVLIVHNCKEEARKALVNEFSNCSSVLIVDESIWDDTYDYTLNCKSENYNESILNLLNKLGEQEQNAS